MLMTFSLSYINFSFVYVRLSLNATENSLNRISLHEPLPEMQKKPYGSQYENK